MAVETRQEVSIKPIEGAVTAFRFSKEHHSTGLGVLIGHLGRVDLWFGVESSDPIIVTAETARLDGVLDELRDKQVSCEVSSISGDKPPERAYQLWERLEGWKPL